MCRIKWSICNKGTVIRAGEDKETKKSILYCNRCGASYINKDGQMIVLSVTK